MSSAFVKEPEGGEAFEDLPDRPISPHPELRHAGGLARIEAELERCTASTRRPRRPTTRRPRAHGARSALLDGAARHARSS